jgi:omega-6 fatty acid desaturase (delta-12 desaturase)
MRRRRAGDIIHQMPAEDRRKRYLPGLLLVVLDATVYLLLLVGIGALPGWWLKGLCVLGAAGAIGGLSVLGHDAAHDTLTPSRRLNYWLARFCFFASYTPLSGWIHAHNNLHHRFLRVRGKDMVWQPWGLEEYRGKPWWGRAWYRFLRTPQGLTFYWLIDNWFRYHFFPRRQGFTQSWAVFQMDRLLVVAFAVGQFLGLSALVGWAGRFEGAEPLGSLGILLVALLLPYLLWAHMMAVIDLVHHTHPRMTWFADQSEWSYYQANVENTAHVVMPLGMNRLFHNILEHTAHHVDPRIPLFNLPGAQARLEVAFADDVLVAQFTPPYVMRLLRTCRLYDFERHCWLDYDGRPTSEPQSVGQRMAMPQGIGWLAEEEKGPG